MPCKFHGVSTHSTFTCGLNPRRKPMKRGKPLKAKKRMKRIGKIGQQLLDQRVQYFQENDPPYYCIYCVFIGIDIPILEEDAQIEHGMTKNNHPGLRFSKDNLYIACSFHNEDKGGMDIDEYLEKLTEQLKGNTWQEQ